MLRYSEYVGKAMMIMLFGALAWGALFCIFLGLDAVYRLITGGVM